MNPQLLIDWLIGRYPQAKRTTLKRMLEQGRVTINGRPTVRAKTEISATDKIEVADQTAVPPAEKPSLGPLKLVFEDADLLVIDKPPGLLTSTVPREKRPTALAVVKSYLAHDRKARTGLIHRLDRDASGLLVFSKSDRAYESLKTQFFHHTVSRSYDAIVHGVPMPLQAVIESLLVESKEGKVFITRDTRTGQTAKTEYEVVESFGGMSRLRVTLHTGRKHQIRAHLASQGNPIVGDKMYGPQPPKGDQLQLRAVALDFDHPKTGKRMLFRIDPLESMTKSEVKASNK